MLSTGNRLHFSLLALLALPFLLRAQESPAYISESFANTSLAAALKTLQDKYQFDISFDHSAVRGIRINRQIQGSTPEEVFQQLLINTGLEFKMVGSRDILLRKMAPPDLSSEANDGAPPHRLLLQGEVIDAFNRSPLPYANLYCSNGQGTVTDEQGHFELELILENLPAQLQISYIGYVPRQYAVSDESLLMVNLVPKVQELESITVTEQYPVTPKLQSDGALGLSENRLDHLPYFLGSQDLFRSLQLLPGISSNDDLSASFSVRGGNDYENGILFDGISLYHIDHFFGIFSAINPFSVGQVNVYKNAFPAEFGGWASSVIDIHSTELELQSVKGEMEFNRLTSNVSLQVPFTSKAGLFAAGRITNKNIARTDLFKTLNQNTRLEDSRSNPRLESVRNQLTTIEPDFRFYDFSAKLLWEIGKNTTISGTFFHGYDDFSYDFLNDIEIPQRRGALESETVFLENQSWENQGVAATLRQQWKKNLSSELTLARSGFQSSGGSDFALDYTAPNRSDSISLVSLSDNRIQGLDLNLQNTWNIDARQTLYFGWQLTHNEVDFNFRINQTQVLDGYRQALQNSFYGQYNNRLLDDKLHLQLGLRSAWYEQTGKLYLSPRLAAHYQLNEQWQIKGAWSRYNQFLRQSTHESVFGRSVDFWVLADDRFPVLVSNNTMLGLHYQKNWFGLDLELYDRRYDGVVEHAQIFNGFSADNGKPSRQNFALFRGTGQTQGLDLMIQKTYGHYTGWIAYTLSKSTNAFPVINQGVAFPSSNDRRHQLKVVQQYQAKKWHFSLAYVFTSGRPYTDLSILAEGPRDRRLIPAEERLSYLDDYHRLDAGLQYNFPFLHGEATLGFSVFNLLNRQNVKYRQYIYSLPLAEALNNRTNNNVLGTELQMLERTPNVSFGWKF